MPNDVTRFKFGDVEVSVWDTGWQSSPHSETDVFGATAHFTRGTVEYFGKFYGSQHDAMRGIHPDLRDVVSIVADELVGWDCDPDDFLCMMVEGISDVDTFRRVSDNVEKLTAAEPISVGLAAWLEGSVFDSFEEAMESWGDERLTV